MMTDNDLKVATQLVVDSEEKYPLTLFSSIPGKLLLTIN